MSEALDAIAYRKLASTLPPVPIPVCGNCENWREFKDATHGAPLPLHDFCFGACTKFAVETIKSHGSWCGEHELKAGA